MSWKRLCECEITHVWHTWFLEVVTGWRISSSICSEKLNNLLEILLYDRGCRWTAKNVYWVVFLVWNLPPGWKLGDGFFFFYFLMSSLYSCNITSKMIFHWWVQYPNAGRCGKGTDHLSLTHFLLWLGMWLCCDVTDICWRDRNKGNSASFYFWTF